MIRDTMMRIGNKMSDVKSVAGSDFRPPRYVKALVFLLGLGLMALVAIWV